jgi:hypothetical protein
MALPWYQWLAFIALGICLVTCLLHLSRLMRAGKPKDISRPAGSPYKGIRFAFTGAMSPARKESAFLHLPTYTAGLLFHLGTFLCLIMFFLISTGVFPGKSITIVIITFLAISASCGIGILIKRIVKRDLRSLSNPDDYISNILVNLYQIFTIAVLLTLTVLQSYHPTVQLLYYLTFTLLVLYLPVGKLRHTLYFFAARYHLGYFFGRRGVWPVNRMKS